jgi:hypothetical protein
MVFRKLSRDWRNNLSENIAFVTSPQPSCKTGKSVMMSILKKFLPEFFGEK